MTMVAVPRLAAATVIIVASGAFSTPAMARLRACSWLSCCCMWYMRPPSTRAMASAPQAAAMPHRRPGEAAQPGHRPRAGHPDLAWPVTGGFCRVRAAAAMTRSRIPSGGGAARASASREVASCSPRASWAQEGQPLRWRSKRARSAWPRASRAYAPARVCGSVRRNLGLLTT